MRFKVKVKLPTGDEKVEFNNAPNEKKLRELYSMMGYTVVEIMGQEQEKDMFDGLDAETMAKINKMNGKIPNMGTMDAVPAVSVPAPKTEPSYKEYTDNGVNYRVELSVGKLQKQDWVQLDRDELKDISIEEGGKMISAYTKKMKLYRLEWVNLG